MPAAQSSGSGYTKLPVRTGAAKMTQKGRCTCRVQNPACRPNPTDSAGQRLALKAANAFPGPSPAALQSSPRLPNASPHLWLFGCCLVHFAEQVLQLRPVTHQLMVDSVSLVQQGVDVGHGLQSKQRTQAGSELIFVPLLKGPDRARSSHFAAACLLLSSDLLPVLFVLDRVHRAAGLGVQHEVEAGVLAEAAGVAQEGVLLVVVDGPAKQSRGETSLLSLPSPSLSSPHSRVRGHCQACRVPWTGFLLPSPERPAHLHL